MMLLNIKEHIASKERFEEHNKANLSSPSVILVFVLVVTALGMLNNPLYAVASSSLLGWVYLASFTALAWLLFYMVFGAFAWYLASWNIPLSLSLSLFCIFLTLFLIGVFYLCFKNWVYMPLAFREFAKVFFLIFISAQTVIAFNHRQMKKLFCDDGNLFPIWFPLTQEYIGDVKTMPKIFNERVIMMKSFNQYTEVSTNSRTEDIRMSLKEAVSLVDEVSGLRVHRSYWVRKSEIESLSYKNGNPFVKLSNGEIVPVGRQMVGSVKAILD